MLKLTKTGIGLLTKQYRSVLRKCLLLNLGLFAICILSSHQALALIENKNVVIGEDASTDDNYSIAIGHRAKTTGWGVALGSDAKVVARAGIAIGDGSVAGNEGSIALGRDSVVYEDNVISVGHSSGDILYNASVASSNLFRRIVNVAEGRGANDAVTVSQLGNIAAGTKILNANGESAITFGTGSGQTTVGTALSTLANQLYNYYYTKTEADARYALLDTIGDVDYSDEAEDEGSALKNGEEDSPTTVRGALDLLDTKIGNLNETGIAGNDIATQLKYILENGSTGGAGVTLSTLGYIGANTPYLNTTSNAMNFSSTYTIGGNMSTLANQIKTNETNIDNLSSRINSLSSYSGTLDLTDNYAKVIGDVNPVTNASLLDDGTNIKAYAAVNKSYTVEFAANLNNGTDPNRYFRVQVAANNEADALAKAKEKIINGWSDAPHSRTINNQTWNTIRDNKYIYDSGLGGAIGYAVENQITTINEIIQNLSTNDVSFTENNYTVEFDFTGDGGYYDMLVDVDADSPSEALDKAKELAKTGWYWSYNSGAWGDQYGNVYLTNNNASGDPDGRNTEIDSVTTADYNRLIEDGDKGYSWSSLLENVAILDAAIGDLSATGVSGASVAAQLKLLGEVGSEALGQKIGTWSTTKDSITQTLGEETKNYGYLTAFEYDSENEQYVGTVGDNLTALDAALSLTAKSLDALSYDLYNYYYTFRVDEIVEVIEFAKELRGNKKEMSSLDFMPIKSSSDLQINLIKAEDPLTFSAKTRDDSLVLMEVCHA